MAWYLNPQLGNHVALFHKLTEQRVTGIEPATFSVGSCKPTTQSTVNTGTCECNNSTPGVSPGDWDANRVDDPQLAQLIDAWAGLPEAVRVGIAAMVASTDRTEPGGADNE